MKVGRSDKSMPLYSTWYGFKQDLEKLSGRSILNRDWLEVKPEAPLPWNTNDLQAALGALKRRAKNRKAERQIRVIRPQGSFA